MNYKKFFGAASAALMIVIIAILVLAPGAWAQSKYKTLYKFTGGKDGSQPYAGLILDQAGNLYGTTYGGGSNLCLGGCGTVFTLSRNSDGRWREKVLYNFPVIGNGSRAFPGSLVRDPAGNLYGTTVQGGGGAGSVFKIDTTRKETTLYAFTGGTDGWNPMGGLIQDAAGNLYGTTFYGGDMSCDYGTGCGTVFKVDARGVETVLYTFTADQDGGWPQAGVILDEKGALYGTTSGVQSGRCQQNCGTVFRLDPDGTLTTLYTFLGPPDGALPNSSLVLDSQGNLYGTTFGGGTASLGTIFMLDSSGKETVLHSFALGKGGYLPVGVIQDAAGNLYGTTSKGGDSDCSFNGYGCGTVFKLTPTPTGRWQHTVLHTFADKPGAYPYAGVVLTQQEVSMAQPVRRDYDVRHSV